MARLSALICGLRFKFALVLALFSGVLMLSVMVLLEQNIRRTLVRENIDKGVGVAHGVAFNAEDPLLTGDDIYLFSALKNAARTAGIRYALIVDPGGAVRAAADVGRVGETFRIAGDAPLVASGAGYRVVQTSWGGEAVLDLEVPIVTVSDTPIRLGDIHLGLSEELITREVRSVRNRLAALTLAALLAAGLVAYVLAGLLVRPVRALVSGVKAIGEGDLDQHIDLKRNDELGVLTDSFNEMAASLREKEFIKNTFERYVSKPLAQQILRHKDELRLGGEEREVTILFADIRRFTTIAEGLPPAQVVEMLNAYFTRMIQVVGHHEGMVDKLMGDSVMALFGVPIALGDDALRAARCALDMQRALAEFNRERAEKGLPHLEMGIGINTGPVVAGNIGSSARMEYTVIGDSVNVAARLQGVARPGEVLISEGTLARVRDRVKVTPMEPMALKGKRLPVPVYRIDALQEA